MLALAAVLVAGLGVYLFLEVRSRPAEAHVQGSAEPRPRDESPEHTVQPTTSTARPAVADAGARATIEPGRKEPTGGPVVAGDPPPDDDPVAIANAELTHSEPKLDLVMAEANKAYDRGDFDAAKTIATKVLAISPKNVRMLRILISSACIEGDATAAQQGYVTLQGAPADRAQMKTRCTRYGIELRDN